MGIGLWLFFMLSAIQPVIRQKMLEASRLRVLHRFERARKGRVIFPQPTRTRPSVEYVPMPYRADRPNSTSGG
jgi:hypothetical protein